MVDASVALALLLLFAPFIFFIAAAIRIESRGGAFYRCRRVGQHGRELWMLKFRKMHDGARGPALVGPDDERFTRLGAFLARTKLDELPQLWNVFKGEMSLVGPRPEDPGFVELNQESYESILAVRPGITGLSQLAFARESDVLDTDAREHHYVQEILPQKIRLDQLYARERSVTKDLAILGWTAAAVILRWDVAVHRQSGRLSVRLPRERTPIPAHEPALGRALLEESES
jgi:lipopolysaccharide/colanic/teichoic acid biosynthesis glycosyltransferase